MYTIDINFNASKGRKSNLVMVKSHRDKRWLNFTATATSRCNNQVEESLLYERVLVEPIIMYLYGVEYWIQQYVLYDNRVTGRILSFKYA